MHLLFRLLAISLPFFVHLHAQSPTSSGVPEDIVSVQFILYGWNCTLPSLRYSPKDKTDELEDPYSVTDVHAYTGPATLNFYSAAAPKPTRDSAPPPPLATVTFPKGATRFIIVTTRASQGRYEMFVVPEDDASSTPPYIRLYNFTSHTLAVNFDESNLVQLAPSSNSTIKPKNKATVLRVAQLMGDGKWRRRFTNVAELSAEGRRNIILAPDARRPVTMYSLPMWPSRNAVAN